MTSIKKGDITSTPEQDLINYAKNKRATDIQDLLKTMKDQEPNTPEFNETRQKVWDGVNKLLYEFDPKDITSDEKKGFDKKIDNAEWKTEKTDIVSTYLEKLSGAKDTFSRTRLENEMKKEILDGKRPIDPEYKSLISRANAAIKEFRDRSFGDQFIIDLKEYSTNIAKADRFANLKREL